MPLPSVSKFYQSESRVYVQFFLNQSPSMNEKRLEQPLEKSTTVSKFDSMSEALFNRNLRPSDHFLFHRLLLVNNVIPSAVINTPHAQYIRRSHMLTRAAAKPLINCQASS